MRASLGSTIKLVTSPFVDDQDRSDVFDKINVRSSKFKLRVLVPVGGKAFKLSQFWSSSVEPVQF